MPSFGETKNTNIAMIFREKDENIDLKILKEFIKSELSIKKLEDLNEEKGIIIFENNDNHYIIARMPVEIPKNDFKSAADYSLLYKDPKKIVNKQKAHIIISVQSKKGNMIENNLKLIKLVRAVIKSTSSLGVYWGSAAQIIQDDIFLAFTDKIDSNNLPIPIWINICRYIDKNNKINVHSIGLKDLGYPEYEIINLKMKWEDAYYYLLDFANYMITSGDLIKDGDTIGRNENEKLKVRFIKSEITEDKKVMRIDM